MSLIDNENLVWEEEVKLSTSNKPIVDVLPFCLAPLPLISDNPAIPPACQRLNVVLTVCSWHLNISAIFDAFQPWAFLLTRLYRQ
jgi:hypothetical protein